MLNHQTGSIKTLPLLLTVTAVGVISFLLISSTGPFKGTFNNLFPKKGSQAASLPSDCTSLGLPTLQFQVDNTPASGTLTLTHNCIYRETPSLNKPITLDGTGLAQIRGSDIWNGWNQSGSSWVSSNTVPVFTAEPPVALFIDSFQANHPEQVFFDGNELNQVPANPVSGQFALDGSRKVILADNPSGHIIEVTVRNRWADVNSDNVIINNLTFKHAGTSSYEAAITNYPHAGFILENSTISNAHGGMIGLGSGAQLLNNTIFKAGDNAVGSYQQDKVVIRGNNLFQNGFGGWDWNWQAGAIKMASATNLTIDGNIVHDNNGPGVWCDIACNGSTWTNNRSYNNVGPGLMYEISNGIDMHGNMVWNNANAGIYISSSTNSQIYNNIVAWNYSSGAVAGEGITVGGWLRPGEAPSGCCSNHYVHDNTIYPKDNTQDAILFINQYGDVNTTNIHGANNKFYSSTGGDGPVRFEYGQNNILITLASFNATPGGGGNSSYISDLTILSQNNMPICPICIVPTPTPISTSTPAPSPQPSLCQGADLDGDGKVGIFDYNILLTNFGKIGTNIQGDLDKDGKVGIFDYNILLTNFGKTGC